MLDEHDKWQLMMHSCRKACRIIGDEYVEPEYLNWRDGVYYHNALWSQVTRCGHPPLIQKTHSIV